MRVLYMILAVIFYVLGLIGLALPVIPQIPFLLAGTFFLAMSSEKCKRWILSHSLYHKHIRPYVERYPKISDLLHTEVCEEEEADDHGEENRDD